MPRMMREIVATVVGTEPDLVLVGEIDDHEALPARTNRTRPDLVIAGANPALARLSRQLLGDYPRLRILEVDVEGRRGYLYELSPRRKKLGELSPKSLLAVAREKSSSSTEETGAAPPTLAGYLGIIRRRKWVVLPGLILGPLVALVISLSQSPLYQASAGVLLSLQPASGVTNSSPPSQPEDPARVVQNQAQVARALPVAQRVVHATESAFPSASSFLANSNVATSTGSDVLTFTVRHSSPGIATHVANEYARQFTVYLQNFETSSVTRALARVQRRLAEMKAQKPANRAVYGALQTKEQELEILEALETPTATLVHAATGATRVQPRLVRNLILGLGLGLLLGIGSAFLSDALDGRIRSEEEVADLLGLPLLGRVSPPRGRLGSGLALLDDPDAKEAEAFRTLRAGLETVTRSRGVRSIMITSALGGDGRSTTVANLGVALARAGRHVLLVDLDLAIRLSTGCSASRGGPA